MDTQLRTLGFTAKRLVSLAVQYALASAAIGSAEQKAGEEDSAAIIVTEGQGQPEILHCLLVPSFRGEQAVIVDPPFMPYLEAVDKINERFTGKALLLSTKPIEINAGTSSGLGYLTISIAGVLLLASLLLTAFMYLNNHREVEK